MRSLKQMTKKDKHEELTCKSVLLFLHFELAATILLDNSLNLTAVTDGQLPISVPVTTIWASLLRCSFQTSIATVSFLINGL